MMVRGKLIFLTQKGKRNAVYHRKQRVKKWRAMLLRDCTKEEVKIAKEVLTKMYKKLYKKVNDRDQLITIINSIRFIYN